MKPSLILFSSFFCLGWKRTSRWLHKCFVLQTILGDDRQQYFWVFERKKTWCMFPFLILDAMQYSLFNVIIEIPFSRIKIHSIIFFCLSFIDYFFRFAFVFNICLTTPSFLKPVWTQACSLHLQISSPCSVFFCLFLELCLFYFQLIVLKHLS